MSRNALLEGLTEGRGTVSFQGQLDKYLERKWLQGSGTVLELCNMETGTLAPLVHVIQGDILGEFHLPAFSPYFSKPSERFNISDQMSFERHNYIHILIFPSQLIPYADYLWVNNMSLSSLLNLPRFALKQYPLV